MKKKVQKKKATLDDIQALLKEISDKLDHPLYAINPCPFQHYPHYLPVQPTQPLWPGWTNYGNGNPQIT
jgi:hypothetical protein